MRAAIYTLGCKVNQYESEYMAEQLTKAGYTVVSPDADADIYIVNSCTVTATADRKTRQHIRKFRREHPSSVIVLTGCMPQAFPACGEELPEADIIIGNKNNSALPALLDAYFAQRQRQIHIEQHQRGDRFASCSIAHFSERVRAFVKIEDGCDRFCSYCIIPMSRGRVRSKQPADLAEEIRILGENGIREIVLVGINLSAYGKGEDFDLADAVQICENDAHILRVRLGSLEPDHLTDGLLERLASCKKLCPQFHISLQSGCDTTLRHMNRHYTADEYRTLCRKLRSTFTNCTLTTDVMTGFHEESEADFNESLAFIREIGFEKVHTFPYSERQGTRASEKGDSVPKAEKERRAAVVIEAAQQIREAYMRAQIGKHADVLFESENSPGLFRGYTGNYIPVKVAAKGDYIGKECTVTLTDYSSREDCMTGVIN